jgi:hypothetical protein
MRPPVVDFHLHCYDRPLRAPESFIAFMDRELVKTHDSFATFLDRHGSAESYLSVLDAAGRALPLSEGARERILGGNAARVLGLV